jgi:phage/plasmid-like protein (TIGR03299 family)
MAHEIMGTDRFGEVRRNGLRAWHGLGIGIPEGLGVREGFQTIGLGWPTELIRIYGELPVVGPDGTPSMERIDFTDHRGHVRVDSRFPLGVVGKDYHQITNAEFADFIDAVAGADAAVSLETAGSLQNGRRVFATVRLPRVIDLPGDDVVVPYVVASNGHGGYASFQCYPTSVRVVCANTLRMSERDASKGLRFMHTGNIADKVTQARVILGRAQAETAKFEEKVRALVARPCDRALAESFMLAVYVECFGDVPDNADAETRAKLLDKRADMVLNWLRRIEAPAQQTTAARGTLWGALNAITEWSDHDRGNFAPVTEDSKGGDARVHSNVFGASADFKAGVFRKALALV